MGKTNVSVRLDDELVEKIDEHNETRADAVRTLVRRGLEYERVQNENETYSKRIQELEDENERLQNENERLREETEEVEELRRERDELRGKVAVLEDMREEYERVGEGMVTLAEGVLGTAPEEEGETVDFVPAERLEGETEDDGGPWFKFW